MSLRKDDPVYYKHKIANLMKQAQENGLKIDAVANSKGVFIYFKSDIDESACIQMLK